MTEKREIRKKEGESGQSTVEFALTLILIMTFALFFIQASLVFAYGNYVHYATFMSARALLSAGSDRGDQEARARTVIIQMLKKSEGQAGSDKFPSIAQGVGGTNPPGFDASNPPQYSPTDRDFSWLQGVRYTFRSRLFVVPLGGGRRPTSASSTGTGQQQDSVNSLTLTSESWLGREPTYSECVDAMSQLKGYWDNGC